MTLHFSRACLLVHDLFFFQAEDGIRDVAVTGVQTCALPIFMLSGALIIETVFAWPGMGRLIVQAVPGRDFPVIQAGVFVFAPVFVAINLIVDVLYTVADPRVRLT